MSNNGTNTKNKRVLMFCPTFFGYENRVADAMRDEGYEVDLYDERPNNGFICKTSLRLNLKLYKPVVRKYIQKVIDENRGKKYDYVFVVKSEAAGKNEIEMLRKAYPEAEFILYFWDSVANVPDGEKKIGLYDRVLTFDPVDAKKYQLIHRPLFFQKEYEAQVSSDTEYVYDAAFIGTAHSIRPRIVKQIAQQCESRNGTCFSYLFLPHPLVYYYNKLLNADYRNVCKEDIHFTPISAEEIRKIYDVSRCIIDVEHSAQRGLTMRTIEMVGMQKKIVTTNKMICEYDFYNPNNICIIDKKHPILEESFLRSEYEPVSPEILQRYTLRSFVQDVFDIKE